MLLSGLLKTNIHQHCLLPGYDLYDTEICQTSSSCDCIHLLWCQLSANGVVNHIVPILKCETDGRKYHLTISSVNFIFPGIFVRGRKS